VDQGRALIRELPVSRAGVCRSPRPRSCSTGPDACVRFSGLHEARLSKTPAASRRPVCDDPYFYAAPRYVVSHGRLEGCLRRSQEVYRGRFIQDAEYGLAEFTFHALG